MTTKEEIIITKYDLLFESRLSKTETSLEHINDSLQHLRDDLNRNIFELRAQMKSDFRWLFGLIVLLGGIMAKGFGWY